MERVEFGQYKCVIETLKELGWKVIVAWECQLKKKAFLKTIVDEIKSKKQKIK
jgi:G:T-mismatch repair DNA endonuclease (very short patch repair protein)